MSDKLRDYIREHRSSFDQMQAPDIWNGVAAGIKQHGLSFKPKNFKSMIKYGFGASTIVIASFIALYLAKPNQSMRIATPAPQNVEKTQRSIFDTTPSVVAGFIKGRTETKSYSTATDKTGSANDAQSDSLISPSVPEAPTNAVEPAEAISQAPLPNSPAEENLPQNFQVTDDTTRGPEFTSIDTSFSGIKRLEVNGQVCHITISTHSGDALKVKGEIREGGGDMLVFGTSAYQRKEYKINIHRSGDVLKVWIADHKLKQKTKCSPNGKIESTLSFEIPESIALKAYNRSGNISLSGPLRSKAELTTGFGSLKAENISGDLQVASSSGNISVSDVTGNIISNSSYGNQTFANVTGSINLRSSSGNITLNNLKGNADISSSYGHQKITDIRGHLVVRSSSGDITIKNLKGNANVKSTYGAQDYELVEGDISSSASSGDIKIADQKGQLILKTSYGNIQGKNITLLNSSEFKASSGNITMSFVNKIDELRFDLISGSGKLTIEKSDVKQSSNKTLQYGNGGITVKGISSYGNQSYN